MTQLQQRVLARLGEHLGAGRLASCVVYLDPQPRRAGERVQVGDVAIDVPWDGHLAFVDYEPAANWGHACAYFALRLDPPDVREYAARMPPFLKAGAASFCALWRGPGVPEWAVGADPC